MVSARDQHYAKNTIENGKPNRKRILVAPQVPSGPVNDRCIALRATWPRAAVTVKGIQSEAMVNMGKGFGCRDEVGGTVKASGRAVNQTSVMTAMQSAPSHRKRGEVKFARTTGESRYAASATTM